MNKKFLVFPLFLSLAACATKGDLNSVLQDMEEMKTRLIQSEKNISAVKVQAKEIAEQSSGEALKTLESLRKGNADMQANLDAMRVDVQVINGKFDDLGVAAKKPLDDISLLKEDTSKAVASMEERLKKLDAEMVQVNAKLTALAKSLEQQATRESTYQQAYDAYRIGNIAPARVLFNTGTEKFPANNLA